MQLELVGMYMKIISIMFKKIDSVDMYVCLNMLCWSEVHLFLNNFVALFVFVFEYCISSKLTTLLVIKVEVLTHIENPSCASLGYSYWYGFTQTS